MSLFVRFETSLMYPRYVSNLGRMKETVIDPLLLLFTSTSATPQPSTPRPDASLGDFSGSDVHFRTGFSGSLGHIPHPFRSLASPAVDRYTIPVPQSTKHTHPRQFPNALWICLEVIKKDLLRVTFG